MLDVDARVENAHGTSRSPEAARLQTPSRPSHEAPERFHLGDSLHRAPDRFGVGSDTEGLLRPAKRPSVDQERLALQSCSRRHACLPPAYGAAYTVTHRLRRKVGENPAYLGYRESTDGPRHAAATGGSAAPQLGLSVTRSIAICCACSTSSAKRTWSRLASSSAFSKMRRGSGSGPATITNLRARRRRSRALSRATSPVASITGTRPRPRMTTCTSAAIAPRALIAFWAAPKKRGPLIS